MNKVAVWIGSTVGMSAGWAIAGAIGFGLMGEFIVSIFGCAAGVYVGRRVANHYEL
jgi:hypothetical protein